MSAPVLGDSSSDRKAGTLRVGDKVAARGDGAAYEVSAVDAQQGRVQVVDTTGGVHGYHETARVVSHDDDRDWLPPTTREA